MGTSSGFAVVDFETTGLSAARGDRAIEVGIVQVAPDGTIEDQAETLIHVERDLGLQSLHHINAAELMHAPDFAGIARRFAKLLEHRVFVAHNAAFDSSFLANEYARLGYRIPVNDVNTVCTLKLARRILGVGALAKCCAICGIDNADAHSALSDAQATAELLGIFLTEDPGWNAWSRSMQDAAESIWPDIREEERAWLPRRSHESPSEAQESMLGGTLHSSVEHSLSALIARGCPEDSPVEASSETVSSYTRLLNASLTNGRLSEHDSIALANLSCELGLSQHQCARIHESYVLEVAQALWEDGVPAKDDLDALAKIGQALSVRPSVIEQATRIDTTEDLTSAIPVITHAVDHAANAYHRLTLAEGDRLALTGSMSRRRSEWEEILRALGIAPQSAVTKATRVLVAADPDTESTKARKARAYQIPIVDEPWLERAVSDGIDTYIAD
ncbi:MAG: hypothetical protein LKI30_00395 [Bifidobacterium crudilactis]|jgi:DNA polymerase-3 subunit epsilon|nr:hypothetical protein [Bifidobacterium crudilactis]